MTPIQLAETIAANADDAPDPMIARALAVGIVLRGLTDPARNPSDRQPWPLDEGSTRAAAMYLHLDPTPELIALALDKAPAIPAAILNESGQE